MGGQHKGNFNILVISGGVQKWMVVNRWRSVGIETEAYKTENFVWEEHDAVYYAGIPCLRWGCRKEMQKKACSRNWSSPCIRSGI